MMEWGSPRSLSPCSRMVEVEPRWVMKDLGLYSWMQWFRFTDELKGYKRLREGFGAGYV